MDRVMAIAPCNPLFAPPRRLASTQPLPFSSLPSCAPPPARTLSIAKRSDALMGFSFSVHASSSSTKPSTDGLNEFAVDALVNVQILSTSTGNPVFLKDLWDQEEGIAVVSLLRHFGCICGWELASELKELIPRFESAGTKLICIGVGTPENARILAERLSFPMDYLYADPDRKAYDVLGLYYGFGRTFLKTKVFSRLSLLKKVAKNYTISATPKDKRGVLQQVQNVSRRSSVSGWDACIQGERTTVC